MKFKSHLRIGEQVWKQEVAIVMDQKKNALYLRAHKSQLEIQLEQQYFELFFLKKKGQIVLKACLREDQPSPNEQHHIVLTPVVESNKELLEIYGFLYDNLRSSRGYLNKWFYYSELIKLPRQRIIIASQFLYEASSFDVVIYRLDSLVFSQNRIGIVEALKCKEQPQVKHLYQYVAGQLIKTDLKQILMNPYLTNLRTIRARSKYMPVSIQEIAKKVVMSSMNLIGGKIGDWFRNEEESTLNNAKHAGRAIPARTLNSASFVTYILRYYQIVGQQIRSHQFSETDYLEGKVLKQKPVQVNFKAM